MTGIYKITSPSGSVYIGQTRNTTRRFPNYRSCSKKQVHIYNSIHKYGYSSHKFEVIHELPRDIEQDILDRYEVFYWKQYTDCGLNLMNIREPGKCGKSTEESRKKLSIALTGRKLSEEHKMKISLSQKGGHRGLGSKKPQSFKQKLSLRSKGNQYAKKN